MATEQIINLATFEFDTNKLEASLSKSQDVLFALRKEAEANTAKLKEVQLATKELSKEQQKLESSGKALTAEYKDNQKTLEGLNEAEKQLFKNQQNIITSQSRVKQEITATTKELKAYMTAESEKTTLADAANKALQTQVTNINQARASNTELLRVRNQLNPAIATEAKLIEQLNAKMNTNNDFIKANASEYEKTKINIGNYTESIKDAIKESGLLGQATNALPAPLRNVITGFGQAKGIITSTFTSYKESQEAVATAQKEFAILQQISTEATQASIIATERATAIGFQYNLGKATQTEVEAANTAVTVANTTATEAQASATAAATVVTNASSASLKLFKIALISTGVGALVVLLGSLVSYLTTTKSGIDALTAVTRPLQAIFQSLMNVASKLGSAIVDAINSPKKAILSFVDLLKENLLNRLKGMADLVKNIINLDFSAAGESAVQAATGVDNLGGKILTAAKNTKAFLKEAADRGSEIDKLTKEMEDNQLSYNSAQREFGDLIDAQLLISKDTSKTFAERAKASEEIIRLTKENGKAEEAIYQAELKIFDLKNKNKELTKDELNDREDILNKIEDAGDRGKEAEKEQIRVIAGFKKEAHEQELNRIKKENDLRLRNLNVELKAYLESKGDKKKSFDDDIAIAQETLKKQLEINAEENRQKIQAAKGNKQELAVIQKEFDLANLEAQNEYLAKSTELTVANANLELEIFKSKNQQKLDENKYFSDELYNQEIDRITRLDKAERDNLKLQFDNKVLNQQEYDLAISNLDNATNEKKKSTTLQREQSEKDRKAADLIVQDELNAERFDYDLQLQQERFDTERAILREQAELKGQDLIEFDKLTAKKREEIEALVMKNKLDVASNTFSNLATLAGEQSTAGKAFAIAATTIDTFQSATAAYKAMAGIPVVGPVLGGIAAAAAVKSGLDTVKRISAVKNPSVPKKPSYARGIIGVGTGESDSIDARLSAGESVLTARASAMFPNEIAAINQAGGGVGLNGLQGSSSAMVQESLKSNSGIDTGAIAEAVYLAAKSGTYDGSKTGIKDLSTDRQIQNDARF